MINASNERYQSPKIVKFQPKLVKCITKPNWLSITCKQGTTIHLQLKL